MLEQAREVASILGNGDGPDGSKVTTGTPNRANGAAGRKGRGRKAAGEVGSSVKETEDS
ncbi:hypothetical protein D3C83_316360 [compost metagenome]